MKKIGLVVSCLMLSGYLMAQDEPIEKLLYGYVDEVNALNKTKDISRLLKFFDIDFRANQTTISLTGKLSRKSSTLNEFLGELEGLVKSDLDIDPNLDIKEIVNIEQGTNKATITANLGTDVMIEGKDSEKNSITVTMIASLSKDGDWKFVHSDIISNINEKNTGKCYCYFYERGSNDFITMLYYPDGIEYERAYNAFSFKGNENLQKVKSDHGMYEWAKGDLLSVETNGEKKIVGKATSNKEVMVNILGQMYSENCLDFVVK